MNTAMCYDQLESLKWPSKEIGHQEILGSSVIMDRNAY